jgi:hypothetical protein
MMAQPTALDVYTTGAAGARQTVFSPGEAIQFNIAHTLSSDLPIGTLYKAMWIIQRYQPIIALDDDDFEVICDITRIITFDDSYPSHSVITWWNSVLPSASPFPLEVEEIQRESALNLLASDLYFALSLGGLWKLTGVVELTEGYTGRPFSSYTGWHFRINL